MPSPYPLKYLISKLFAQNESRGDIIVRDITGWVRKAIGLANQILASDGTDIVWTDNIPSNLNFVGQTNGDIIIYDSSWKVLHKGSDSDVLNIDPITHLPKWIALSPFNAQTNITVGGVTDTLENFLILGM